MNNIKKIDQFNKVNEGNNGNTTIIPANDFGKEFREIMKPMTEKATSIITEKMFGNFLNKEVVVNHDGDTKKEYTDILTGVRIYPSDVDGDFSSNGFFLQFKNSEYDIWYSWQDTLHIRLAD